VTNLALAADREGRSLGQRRNQHASNKNALQKTRSRNGSITCDWFRHQGGADCIPLLACQLRVLDQ
jgi:hypothetical protein